MPSRLQTDEATTDPTGYPTLELTQPPTVVTPQPDIISPTVQSQSIRLGLYIIIVNDDPRDIRWDLFQADQLVQSVEFGNYKRRDIYYEMIYVESPSTFSLIMYVGSEIAGDGKGPTAASYEHV